MRNPYCMISMLIGFLSMNLAFAQSDCLDELDCGSSWLQLTDADRKNVNKKLRRLFVSISISQS